MDDKRRDNTKEEMSMEELLLMKKIEEDPKLRDLKAPEQLREKVFEAIHEIQNEQIRECLSEEDKELLRLGKIYRKKRKYQKYLVLAAVMVMVLAIGITSVGGAEKVFEKMTWLLGGRRQTSVDSSEIIPVENVVEEDVYQEIEAEFGFLPVRMMYLPKGIELLEANIYDEMLGINIVYGIEERIYIRYLIQPNYRESSWGQDIEDELVKVEKLEIDDVEIQLREYSVEDNSSRWEIRFVYNDVSYSIMINDYEFVEVEKIINNLYFFR